MTTQHLTPAVAPSPVSAGGISCREYISLAEIREEFGSDVAGVTDVALQRRADRLVDQLEEQLGHTFGRAFLVRSSASDTVAVTATGVLIGGDGYAFATYPTLQDLSDAINGAGKSYAAWLRPEANPITPSSLLNTVAAGFCGPTYDKRMALCVSAMYVQLSGKRSSHVFLPLKLQSVVSVVEDGVTLATTDYSAVPGDLWLVRRAGSGCSGEGKWSNRYPGNILVAYVPRLWAGGTIPMALSDSILQALRSVHGLEPFESESFGEYSYKRPTVTPLGLADILGGATVRQYACEWQP